MPLGYFGSTEYDKLRVKIDGETSQIDISLASDTPEYLNLGKIEFFYNDKPGQPIDIFGSEYGGIAVLSSKFGEEGRSEASFEISKGIDIHSEKELHPKLSIRTKKNLRNFTITIGNRSDYWGIRSSSLKVEAFLRKDEFPHHTLERHFLFDLSANLSGISNISSKRYRGDSLPVSDGGTRSSVCDALDSGSMKILEQPWPLLLNITSLAEAEADDDSVKIWAAFLLVQHLKSHDCSLLNLLNAEDKDRLGRLLLAIDNYASIYSLDITAEDIILSKAKALVKDGRWRLAKTYYAMLLDIDSNNIEYRFGLAECYDTLKLPEKAKPIYISAIQDRPEYKPEHLEMFSLNQRRIRSRVLMYDFIQEHLKTITDRAHKSLSSIADVSTNKIFCYWAQGFGDAPLMVSACQRQMAKYLPSDSVILLHESNLKNYVTVPEHIKDKLSTRSAFFSDILRLLLLSKFGGTWMDATCYLTGPVDPTHRSSEGPFTAYSVGSLSSLSVWYLKCRNDSWLIHMWKEAMLAYWEHHDEEVNYFIFHHVFEALYRLDKAFKAERDAVDQLPSSVPHEWYFSLADDFDLERYKAICNATNIHKLTYKTTVKMERAESFYSYAIRGF